MATIDTVLWDLDGTILDSIGVLEDGLASVLPKYNLQRPSRETLEKNFHGKLEASIDGALGGIDGELLDKIVAEFLTVQDAYYEHIDSHLFADAIGLMGRLHKAGKRQIITTSRAHQGRLRASPRHIVENSIMKNYISRVICGDDSEYHKPDPRLLQAVSVESLGNILVIGDQFVDAELAHNLNARAILVARSGSSVPHLERLRDNWQAKTEVVSSLSVVAKLAHDTVQ